MANESAQPIIFENAFEVYKMYTEIKPWNQQKCGMVFYEKLITISNQIKSNKNETTNMENLGRHVLVIYLNTSIINTSKYASWRMKL